MVAEFALDEGGLKNGNRIYQGAGKGGEGEGEGCGGR